MNYYISIALLWEDYVELQKKVDELRSRIPWSHCLVRKAAWHCTLFAIARLVDFRNPYSTPSEAMQSVLEDLPKDDIERILKAHLNSLRVRASEFRIYENSSNIQFLAVDNGSSIAQVRRELSGALARFSLPLNASVCLDFPMVDKAKNEGKLLYGSFARRAEQLQDNRLLHQESIELQFFEPKSLQVTVSDDALTNIRQPDRDYFIVALRED
jgi:hypothetical protein